MILGGSSATLRLRVRTLKSFCYALMVFLLKQKYKNKTKHKNEKPLRGYIGDGRRMCVRGSLLVRGGVWMQGALAEASVANVPRRNTTANFNNVCCHDDVATNKTQRPMQDTF